MGMTLCSLKFSKKLCLLGILFGSRMCLATDVPESLQLNVSHEDNSKGANYLLIQPVQNKQDQNSIVKDIIPTDMGTTNDQTQVATKIVDKSVNSIFNSDSFKKTSIGQTAHTVEQKMQTNVSVGGEDDLSIKHNFSFKMAATNQKAIMDYTGFFKAQASYQAANQTTTVEVFRDLGLKKTKLAYDWVAKPGDTSNTVSLKWNF